MLVELQIKNFRSFRDLQRFSLATSSDKSMLHNTIATDAVGGDSVLRSAVIYGANASGKTNLIAALAFISTFVAGRDDRKPGEPIPVQPFLLDRESRVSPSTFEVTFIAGGVRYQYGFIVDERRVHEEWLYAYPKHVAQQWFRRTPKGNGPESEWKFGPHFRGDKERIARLTRPDNLFLSVAAQFNQQQIAAVYDWFTNNLRVITAGELLVGDFFERISARMAGDDDGIKAALTRLLRIADLGITDFTSEERTLAFPPSILEGMTEETRARLAQQTSMRTRMRHQAKDDSHGGVWLPLSEESLGTRRLFGLGYPLWITLGNNLLLAADELDASLHPHIVHWIVKLFQNPDLPKRTAQLIFNTHDTTLLEADLFRRDQVWFVEKDNDGASHLYPLLEYSPRKDEALAKGYLRGRYGAVPFLNATWDEIDANAQE